MRSVKAIFWGLLILLLSRDVYPQSVQHVATTLANISDLKVIGNYAYCVFSNGLLVLDASDPTAIAPISRRYLEGYCQDIDVSGHYAYLAAGASGLQIFDINDPSDPVPIGGYNTPSDAVHVFVSDGYAYLASGDSVEIVDVTDPANPAFVSSFGASDAPVDVYVSGNFAYVADYYSGLFITDISDPHNPSYAGSYDSQYHVNGLHVLGDYAYLATEWGLEMIDVSDPHEPSLAASLGTSGPLFGVYAVGHYALTSISYADAGWGWRWGGFEIIDTSNLDSLYLVAVRGTSPLENRLSVYENKAYVVCPRSLWAIDISNPPDPVMEGTYEYAGFCSGAFVSSDYAYVIHSEIASGLWYEGGLQIVDISNPYNPALGGSYDSLQLTTCVFVSGGYAYVTENRNGIEWIHGRLAIFDVSDPHNPVFASYVDYCPYDNTRDFNAVSVSGDYAFVGCIRDLIIENVSDPYHPSNIGECFVNGEIEGIFVSGNYAYVAQGDAGLGIVDVSDPTNPAIAGSLNTPGFAMRVCVSGDYAFVADANSGLQIIDISDSYNPTLAGSYLPPDIARSVFVSGNYAFIAATHAGLQVVDISDPQNPSLAVSYDTPGQSYDVFVDDNYVYLADYTSLKILRFDPETGIQETEGPPKRFALSQNYPNPFNAATKIEFDISAPSDVEVAVYDVQGRRVTTLLDGQQQPGHYNLSWHAGDIPSGIYFARLHAGSRSQAIRMTLLK